MAEETDTPLVLVVGGPRSFVERVRESAADLGVRFASVKVIDAVDAVQRSAPEVIVATQETVAGAPETFQRLGSVSSARLVAFDAHHLEGGELEILISASLAGPDEE